jgi:predicted thioesterase
MNDKISQKKIAMIMKSLAPVSGQTPSESAAEFKSGFGILVDRCRRIGYYSFNLWEDPMSTFESIRPGLTYERMVTVAEKQCVMHTKIPVLSTPMMIDLMESVAKGLIETLLPPEFITVGYEVQVKHKAAAVVGTQVKAWCKILEVDGRKLLFEVRVTAGDKVIGEGQHRRTIIPYSE